MKKNINEDIAKLIAESLTSKKIGDSIKAEHLLKKVLKIEPNNFIALNNLGNIYSEKNNFKKAKIFLSKAIRVKKKLQ